MQHRAHFLGRQCFPMNHTVSPLNVGVVFFNPLYTSPFPLLVIDAAASVQTLLQDFQLRPFSEKNALTTLKMSSPVVLPSKRLQKSMCSQMSSVSMYFTKVTSCAFPLTSVDSSSWSEKESPSFPTTCSTVSVPILSILRQTVSLDKGTVFNVSADFFCPAWFWPIQQRRGAAGLQLW